MSKELWVSASQLAAWKACSRKWAFQSVDKLEPLAGPGRALAFGTAFHNALEALHAPGEQSPEDRLIMALAVWRAEEDDGSWLADGQAIDGGAEPYFHGLGKGMTLAYAAHEARRIDHKLGQIDAVELAFPGKDPALKERCTLGYTKDGTRVVLVGRLDGMGGVAANGPFVVEHKTAQSVDSVEPRDLVLDEQVTAMCFAASRIYDRPILSVCYNVVAKPQHKFQTRGHEHETVDDFALRLKDVMLDSPGRFFVRQWTHRTPAQVEEWRREVVDVVAPLMLSRVTWAARKGSWDGPCRNCPFLVLCEHHDDKARVENMKATMFQRKVWRG